MSKKLPTIDKQNHRLHLPAIYDGSMGQGFNSQEQKTDKYKNITSKCTPVSKLTFPFHDMCFYWTKLSHLATKAYLKSGQKIQYISKESTHKRSCLAAIPSGVLKRLSCLTSQDDKGIAGNKQINNLYPDHWNVLLNANLVKKSDKPLRMKTL